MNKQAYFKMMKYGAFLKCALEQEDKPSIQERRKEIPQILAAKKNSQSIHQPLGNLLGTFLSTSVGAALGGALGGSKESIMYGGAIGAATPSLVAALAALLSRRRSLEQQKKYEQSSPLLNYLPGVSIYNMFKNRGVLMSDEYQQARKKKHAEDKKKKQTDQNSLKDDPRPS